MSGLKASMQLTQRKMQDLDRVQKTATSDHELFDQSYGAMAASGKHDQCRRETIQGGGLQQEDEEADRR